MKNYVIYNSSGEILRCGSVSDPSFSDIQDADNEFELLSNWPYDVENYHVVDSQLVQKAQTILDQQTNAENYSLFIQQRNALLVASDYTQLPDSPLTDTKKQEWAIYRQQLRDLPTTVDLTNITWPSKPT